MNDRSQNEINDELLSAYLDDELSADERALVEARLGADPAARHTLEQLRHVSQSVRDLPQQQVGRDLREAILTRAQASRVARPESAKGVADPSADIATAPTPPLTIARTPRAWFWASLAIAAALLIMFLLPGDNSDDDLSPIAKRDKSNSDNVVTTRQDIAGRAPASGSVSKELAGRATSSETRQPNASAPSSRDLAESKAEAPANPNADFLAESELSDQRLAPQSAPVQLDIQPSEPSVATAAPAQPAAPAAPNETEPVAPPLVVNLLAKPSAIENRSFEKVLHKYGVNFEPTESHAASEGLEVRGESVTPYAARSNAVPADAPAAESQVAEPARKTDATPKTDGAHYVLVDAPSSTIYSCVSDLNKDADNFAAISVEPLSQSGPQPYGGAAPAAVPPVDLKQFERGFVPPAKDVAKAHDYRLYHEAKNFDALPEQQLRGGTGGVGGGSATDMNRELGTEAIIDRGRARRLQTADVSGRESLERSRAAARTGPAPGASGSAAAAQQNQPQRFGYRSAPATPLSSDNDRMQVLFVIRPGEDQTPALKAKNQPE